MCWSSGIRALSSLKLCNRHKGLTNQIGMHYVDLSNCGPVIALKVKMITYCSMDVMSASRIMQSKTLHCLVLIHCPLAEIQYHNIDYSNILVYIKMYCCIDEMAVS